MRSDRRVPVAIIGGGFSGTIIAAQLARRGVASVLIDGSGRAGKGVAYSTTEAAHLLNVRAEGMSAWAGEPDNFANRFEQEGGDRRGRQSAALVVTTTEDFPDISLRVDDHAEPLTELSRLLALWRVQAEPSQHTRPSKANPAGLTDMDAIEAGWRARGLDIRFRR